MHQKGFWDSVDFFANYYYFGAITKKCTEISLYILYNVLKDTDNFITNNNDAGRNESFLY
jgi:hypothetical protein